VAATLRLPAIYSVRDFGRHWRLLSYARTPGSLSACGGTCRQILKGEKPAEIPVEQPTRFNLIVNLTLPSIGACYTRDVASACRRGDRVAARSPIATLFGPRATSDTGVRAKADALLRTQRNSSGGAVLDQADPPFRRADDEMGHVDVADMPSRRSRAREPPRRRRDEMGVSDIYMAICHRHGGTEDRLGQGRHHRTNCVGSAVARRLLRARRVSDVARGPNSVAIGDLACYSITSSAKR